MRTSVYGIFINLIHSLSSARSEDPNASRRLREILTFASNDETLRAFGLKRVSELSNELVLCPHADGLNVESLEYITGILVELITLGAPSSGKLSPNGVYLGLISCRPSKHLACTLDESCDVFRVSAHFLYTSTCLRSGWDFAPHFNR